MKKERTFFDILKRFTGPYWNNPKTTIKSVIFYCIWAILPIMHIYFAQKIVEAIELNDKDIFINLFFVYFCTWVSLIFFNFLVKNWWIITNIASFRKTIHNFYLNKFIWLSNTQTEKIGTWKLISIIWTGMDTWALLLNRTVENIIKLFLSIFFTVYMISIINIWAWIIFTIFYIIVHIIGWYFNKQSLIHRRKRQNVWNDYTWILVKIMMSKFEILQTGNVKTELNKVNKINDKLLGHSINMATPTFWFYYTPWIFINLVRFWVFWFVWYQVILWNLTLALFVWMFGVISLMNNVIINSMIFFSEFTSNFTKIEKMWDFFDETSDIKWYEDWNDFEYKNWNIKLEKISFWYNEKTKIFKDFDLEIKWWQITALVWNSWSWKSTLVKLISWYIKSDSWKIIIDWQNLEKVNLKSFYKNIWYLTQEPSVFDWSILDNLLYWSSDNIDDGIIKAAIKKSKCEFIYDLEDWIDTEIWEKWIRLSWWQRQRLAIAKIFLKDPKIIILDEPTSALDSFSEEQITKSLNNLFEWRTVIIIAHRLQTVKNADKIIVLEDWKIVEEWDHKKLVEGDWIYKKMLDLQSGF